jgi:hypothetical protein
MLKAFEFCIPTKAASVPSGPDWLHEVKYDGYRLWLQRDGDRVRLITEAATHATTSDSPRLLARICCARVRWVSASGRADESRNEGSQ